MAKKEMIKLAKKLQELEEIIDTGTADEVKKAHKETEDLISKIVRMYGFEGMFEIDEYICTHPLKD